MSPAVELNFGITFYGCNDLVITLGPLIITSISTEDGSWGAFEILWNKRGYLYCYLYQEMDCYKMKDTGFTCPEWYIQLLNKNKEDGRAKETRWSSTPLLMRCWDWYHNIKTKYSTQG